MLNFGESYGVDWQTAMAMGLDFFGDGSGTPNPDPPQPPSQQPNPQQGFERLVQRQGGADAAAFLLYQENHSYREKLRQAEQQLRDLQGKLPGEGAVVLDADKAKAWEAYQALGAPDEVKKVRDEYAGLKREAHFRTVAEVHGFNPVVLAGLPGAADLTIELGEETLNGKTAKVAYVVQQDGKKIALPDYAKQTWEPFLPALQQGNQPTQTKGTPFVRQQTGSGAAPANKVEEWREKQRKAQEGKKNPLMSGS
jgi:hypothetical protein